MIGFLHILAKDDPIVLAVIAIFVLIGWAMKAISAITENARKQAQRCSAQTGALVRGIQPNVGRPGGPVMNRMISGTPRVAAQAVRLPPVATLAAMQRLIGQGARRVMPKQGRAIPQPPVTAPAIPIATVKPAIGASIPSAPQIPSWLNAKTLRSQFILSEAMQPPLGLRTRSHLP